MKKKLLANILCIVMIAVMAVGCGFSDEPAVPNEEATVSDVVADETDDLIDETESEYHFEIIIKSYQSSYWQAAVAGVEQAAEELGVTVNCTGPGSESDIADQINMLNKAINVEGVDGIGLAACDQSACMDSLQTAMDQGIPVVCFDSGISNAPEGSVFSTVATDNYLAGALAAENLYAGLSDVLVKGYAPVRVGEINQDDTSESIISRGLGFIDRFAELAEADGKSVAVIGNDRYVEQVKAETVEEEAADIIIEVAVPTQTSVNQCADVASDIMERGDIIGIFASNQVASEGVLTANEHLHVLGTDPETSVLAAGFDSGIAVKDAIRNGEMYGAVTQTPFEIGAATVRTLYAIANGKTVSDIPTKGYWYNADNMNDDSIAPNLYD